MDNVDFGSPALQAMSVPAIVVLVVLVIVTIRSVALGDRAIPVSRVDRDAARGLRKPLAQRARD